MSKAKIIDKKSVDSILGEKNLLSQLHHPFIVNMVYSFQDLDYLYLVMDKYGLFISRFRLPLFSNGFITRRKFTLSFMCQASI